MHKKSGRSFKSTLNLQNQDSNGAANRAYYAIFQAIVAELSAKYKPEHIDPEIVNRKRDPNYDGGDWRHAFCRSSDVLTKYLTLDRKERSVVKQAWSLRVKADYHLDDVKPEEIAEIIKDLKQLLPTLGVEVR